MRESVSQGRSRRRTDLVLSFRSEGETASTARLVPKMKRAGKMHPIDDREGAGASISSQRATLLLPYVHL
jgi:hypothetical protein